MYFPKHLTGIKDLSVKEINDILELAFVYKKLLLKRKIKEELKEYSVINLFFENSTRTRISFEHAENLLGMKAVNFNSSSSSLQKGESIIDTIKNLDAMKFDFIVARHSTPGFPFTLIKYSSSRIINAGDGMHEHPTQALLDLMTLQEIFNDVKNKKICIVGDVSHNRAANSVISILKKFKAKLSVCGPECFIPASIHASAVKHYYDLDEAIVKNDALILLRVQLEREAGNSLPSLNEYRKYYGVTADRLKYNDSIKILHPGPFNKNVELDEDILDGKDTYIFQQVTNGVAVKLALFNLMSKAK